MDGFRQNRASGSIFEGRSHDLRRSAVAVCTIMASVAVVILCATGCENDKHAGDKRVKQQSHHRNELLTGVFLGDEKLLSIHYQNYIQQVGRKPDLLMTFVAWPKEGPLPFPAGFCRFAADRNATPVITWEPWEPWSGWYPKLADIAEGQYDARITEWAQQAAAFENPILLRFAHEMNGDWYPWSERKDPEQTAEAYVETWQHLHRLFAEAGAENVRFVWSPNFEPIDRLEAWYPPPRTVDFIGASLYNHPEHPGSPAKLLTPFLAFAEAHEKPILLAEVGCAETFTGQARGDRHEIALSKPPWIESLFTLIASRHSIHGVVWFDVDKEADWRIASSEASVLVYRNAVLSVDESGEVGR